MNSVIDDSLVALALLVSGGYALLSLGPKSLRRLLLAALSRRRRAHRHSSVCGERHNGSPPPRSARPLALAEAAMIAARGKRRRSRLPRRSLCRWGKSAGALRVAPNDASPPN